MGLTEFLFADENLQFLAAASLVMAILAVEVFASLIGVSVIGKDFDFDADKPDIGFMGWLNAGQVPLLVLLTTFLGLFTILGFTGQWIVKGITGILVPGTVAGPLTVVLCLPIIRKASLFINKMIPREETSAISLESLVGSVGTVILQASKDMAGQMKVSDDHGTTHYVFVHPEGNYLVQEGEDAVLIDQIKAIPPTFTIRKI